jgi:pyruvate dehydrogenase E2 component (dihydrolipoamide acetyltransferase)
MQTNVYLPQLELTMTNVTVATVRVREGDWVELGQPLLEVESEKALSEVPAPKAGCVRKVFVQPGQVLLEKALLCILTETADEPVTDPGPTGPASLRLEQDFVSTQTGQTESDRVIKAAPAARKLAKDRGIDLATITGTGPGGRVTVEDVRNA